MKIGQKIKILLAFYNMTNKDLANKLGIAAQSVSNYITGVNNPPVDVVQKMAEVFQVSIDFLINEKFKFHIVYRDNETHQLPTVAEPAEKYQPEKIDLGGLSNEEKEIILKLIKAMRKPK